MSCLFHWLPQHLVAKGIRKKKKKERNCYQVYSGLFLSLLVFQISVALYHVLCYLSSGGKNMVLIRPRKAQAQKGSIQFARTAPLAHIQGTTDGKLLLMEENLIWNMRETANCEKMRIVTFVSDAHYTIMFSIPITTSRLKTINKLKKYSLSFSYFESPVCHCVSLRCAFSFYQVDQKY